MARLSLNKASLHKESAKLKRYRQYLPSLDLKRRQLMAERAKGLAQLKTTELQIEQCRQKVSETLPMVSYRDINLNDLVKVSAVEIGEENIVGITVPILRKVDLVTMTYSSYLKPHWVDALVVQLKLMLELKLRQQVDRRRLTILEAAVKKVTQKVNLFDKVLIPKTERNIRKIRIYLSDAERADVVRAKMTKQLRIKQGV
ncbi:V-type ATP synthase subunit D [Methylotuvimicrobium alcaliphilum]|uniref:V-type ATP synthase subunit D n=1 Tax=Methylotuvimicrobium alcaliphilum (strain DSM 19304 / NCIMB 14124 / VKM B-2133 / 20Z) TaxID=1091494 RepID=G4T049_META2|nr:V-type ATP synthase subunit D [Methylotuvimicrobium alcaliphilum]CCE23339.1 V-type ATP synthase subunit D [Methylotuvimicrobium alcaliphilum 20Z]